MYVIQNTETKGFIAIDKDSGGYPFETEIERAERFHDKQAARQYRAVMHDVSSPWALYELVLSTKPDSWY